MLPSLKVSLSCSSTSIMKGKTSQCHLKTDSSQARRNVSFLFLFIRLSMTGGIAGPATWSARRGGRGCQPAAGGLAGRSTVQLMVTMRNDASREIRPAVTGNRYGDERVTSSPCAGPTTRSPFSVMVRWPTRRRLS